MVMCQPLESDTFSHFESLLIEINVSKNMRSSAIKIPVLIGMTLKKKNPNNVTFNTRE